MLDALSTRLALAGNQSNSPSHRVKDNTPSNRRYSGTYDRYNSGEGATRCRYNSINTPASFPRP